MKKIVLVALLSSLALPAFAQAPVPITNPKWGVRGPAGEAEIASAFTACQQHKNTPGPMDNQGMSKKYDPGFENCNSVESAWAASQTKKDAETASHKAQIDSIAGRLPK
jgi:hypothetical protein